MFDLKSCDICGSTEGKIRHSKKFNKTLCPKHYQHFLRVGHEIPITTFDPNEVIMYDDYAELILRNIKHEEVGRTKISLCDLEEVRKHKWVLRKDGYVGGKISGKKILLHRFLLNVENEIDHINRDRIDNRRENMRESNRFQNTANRGIVSKRSTSGHIGVTFHSRRNKWIAHMRREGKLVLNKGFEKIEDAIKARELADKEYNEILWG